MQTQPEVLKPEAVSKLNSKTLPALYDFAERSYPERVVMKSRYPWGFQSITYTEFDRQYSSLGAGLVLRGLGHGDRVALIAENSPEWAMVYAAVTACGAIIVPLDIQTKENEIRHLLMHCEARFLVTSQRIMSDRIEGMHLGGVEIIVIGQGEEQEGMTTLADVIADGMAKIKGGEDDFFRRKTEVRPEDPAAICYTSGTTGQPKGAVLTHGNLVSNAEGCRYRLPFREGDIFLSLLPLNHTFAVTCNFLAPLFAGCTIFFGRSLKSRDIREDIQREGVTILVGVPLLFEHMVATMRRGIEEAPQAKRLFTRILKGVATGLSRLFRRNVGRAVFKNKLAKYGLDSLRFLVSGAAPLRPDVEKTLFSVGLPVLQGYGCTEASPVISVNPLMKPKYGTVGTPLPDVEVDISQPNDEGIGEIIVRGPNIMKEYLKNPEATADVLRNGWLYTGDLASKDADGYITIVGRKKSVIVTPGGKNVYPDEIEIQLNKSPFILESMVLASRDKRDNERIAAIIVPDYDALGASKDLQGKLTEESIREAIAAEIGKTCQGLPDFKRVVDFQIRDEELPKTTTRKVKRHLVTWIEE